jgi:tRNA threonylcarbamoyladenosine biosynthesis protein TsaB
MLLAIDTATRLASIALYDETGVWSEESWRSRNNHSVEVMPAIANMLARQRIAHADLAGVAVPLGPGSFTGLRIGMSLAKGICLGMDIPLVAVPTLQVTAYAAGDPGVPVLSVLEAGRGRISVAKFVYEDGLPAPAGDAALVESALWEPDLSGPVLLTGEIDAAMAERLLALPDAENLSITSLAGSLRRAGFLAELAWDRLQRGDVDDLDTLSPIYMQTASGSPGP